MMALAMALVASDGCGNNIRPGGEQDSLSIVDTNSTAFKLKLVNERLATSPGNADIWLERANLFYEMGNLPQAMLDCGKSIELNVTNPDAYHFRGFLHYTQSQDSAALRDLKRAAQLGSMNPETFYMTGQIFFLQKDYPMALEGYNNAISLDSLSPVYFFARGYLYQQQGKIDAAIAEYRLSLERDPGFIKVLVALFDIYMYDKKDPDQAYLFNDRILKVDSMHPVGRYNQGNYFLNRANNITSEEGLIDFQVLLKLAVSEYSKSLSKDPKYALAYYNRGYAYYLLEAYGSAMDDFNKVIELDPMNERAYFMKASIQEFKGDLASALTNYEQSLRLKADFKDASKAVKELKIKLKR